MLVAVVLHRVSVMEESFPTSAGLVLNGQAPSPADSVSLMQSVPVVDRLSMYERELATLTEDTDPRSDKAPAAPKPHALLASASSRMQELVSNHMGAKTSTGMVGVLLVLLTLCLLCALASVLFGGEVVRRRRQQDGAGGGQSSKDIAASLEARDRMGANTSPLPGSRTYQPQHYQRTVSGASLTAAQPFLGAGGSPHLSGIFLPDPRTSTVSCVSITDQQRQTAKPPPLCPTLVMPMSEALLGIQMYELAQLNQEGSLNIVGISGKPLLRAEVRKNGNTRTLEIAMPEPNSIPRASIGPPTSGESKNHGSRVLEIRGMRGVFYGTLEMRSSGACYVVKDGQTVLTIDGDAESLQLSLKSSQGLQLAAVKCSTEQFEGVDHVEVRVEPGVDTVLVIAVVLAVLLLSPYLPPADD